jgi:hypothetical protein
VCAHRVAVGEQAGQRGGTRVHAFHQRHDRRRADVVAARTQPAMPWPGPLQIQPERRGQREHPQRIRRRRAVDHDVIPLSRLRQLTDLVKAENLLDTRQRRKLFGGNLSQLGFLESGRQQACDLAPASLEQCQRVQRQRIEETAAGVGVVGHHPGRCPAAGRSHRRAEHVAERVRLVGGHHENPQAAARVAHRGRGRQRRLAYAALANEETDSGLGRRGGFTQPRLVS